MGVTYDVDETKMDDRSMWTEEFPGLVATDRLPCIRATGKIQILS